jgi:hypothetical protein
MVRRRDVLAVTDVARGGRTVFGQDGVRMTLHSIQASGNLVSIQFAISIPRNRPFEPHDLDFRLTDSRGRDQRATSVFTTSFPQTVREPEAEHLLWWAGPPQGLGLTALPWTALAQDSRRLDRRRWTGSARFSLPQPIDASTRLTLFRFERVRTELSFEFRDLPLP